MEQLFQYILNNYLNSSPFVDSNAEWYKVMCKKLPNEVSLILKRSDFVVTGSTGIGNKTVYPWISIMNKNITTTPQKGLYMVYLFRKDMTGFYLSLNQGITHFEKLYKKNRYKCALKASDYFRTQIKESSFSKNPIRLCNSDNKSHSGELGYGYEHTNIISKFYKSNAFTYEQLKKDLIELTDVYDDMVKHIKYSYEKVVENVLNAEAEYSFMPANEAIDSIKEAIDPNDEMPYGFHRSLQEQKPQIDRSRRFNRVTNPIVKKTDYIKKAQTDLKNGLIGEELVLEWEKNKLINAGRQDLANKINWLSKQSDAFGYDIDSFELDKNGKEYPIKIEVKATATRVDCDFFISKHEIDTSKKYKDQYCIYRVYDVNAEKPKFYRAFGEVTDHFELDPITFMAKYKGNL